jgi:hypothetical protein
LRRRWPCRDRSAASGRWCRRRRSARDRRRSSRAAHWCRNREARSGTPRNRNACRGDCRRSAALAHVPAQPSGLVLPCVPSGSTTSAQCPASHVAKTHLPPGKVSGQGMQSTAPQPNSGRELLTHSPLHW